MKPGEGSRVGLLPAALYGLLLSGTAWGLRFTGQMLPGSLPAVTLPLWVVLSPAAVGLAVWSVLALRGYPAGGRLLTAGLPLLALTIGLDILMSRQQPVAPADQPAQVTGLPVAEGSLLPEVREAVIFREPRGPTPLRVVFRPVSSVGGHWAYQQAGVESGAFSTATAPDRTPDWSGTVSSDGTRAVTPSYQVDLPLGGEHERQRITLRARMDLVYPAAGQGGYTDVEERRGRDIALFVGSPQDRAFRSRWDAWRQGQVLAEGYWLPIAGLGLLALLPTAAGLRRLARAGGRGPGRVRDDVAARALISQVARDRSAAARGTGT